LGVTLILAALVLAPIGGAQEPASAEPPAAEPAASEPAAEEPAATEEAPDAEETPESEAPAEAAAGPVVLGTIDGEIGLSESAYVKRLIEAAEERGASALLIRLNTFGGRVDAAVAIRDALLDAPFHTGVFIDKRAISAGALISLACEKIVISPGGTIGAATPIVTTPGQELPEPVEEKYLSYFRQEMRVTAETRGRNGDVAEAMVDADIEVEGVVEEGKLLTLTTTTALELGIADHEAASVDEALAALGWQGPVETVGRSWAENLVGFLTSPAIASLLFLGMAILAYLEYQTPGFGAFGYSALVCFLLLYFSHYLVNLAGWEELLLFAIGVILVVIELVAIPGFGLLGIGGLVCIVASAVLMLMAGDFGDLTFENPFTVQALTRVLVSIVLALVVIAALVRFVALGGSRGGVAGRLVLTGGLTSESGYSSHQTSAGELVGKTGTALTPLRPAGKARIAGKRWNVETEGGFVEEGEEVRVLRQGPGRIVVRRAAPAPPQTAESSPREPETSEPDGETSEVEAEVRDA
jgi:membrane-bound serine protease (ClpP class)